MKPEDFDSYEEYHEFMKALYKKDENGISMGRFIDMEREQKAKGKLMLWLLASSVIVNVLIVSFRLLMGWEPF